MWPTMVPSQAVRTSASCIRHGQPVLGKLTNVEFELEMVAENRLNEWTTTISNAVGFDQALKLRTPIIRRRHPRLDIGVDEFVSPRLAIGLALALLVRNRDIVLRLARG